MSESAAKLGNWQEEKQAAFLYGEMARVENNHPRRGLFLQLSEAAEQQAAIWASRYRDETGQALPEFTPTTRARVVAKLVRWLGPRRVRPVLSAMKVRGMSIYRGAPALVAGHPMPQSVDDIGHRHKGIDAGGNLRAAVFGINDGLVSNASLLLGVAGATDQLGIIYLTGVAGMLAGAFSMAAGEYISMRSQRELYEYQIGLERDELAQYPEEEAEELALIYNARGIPIEEARRVASDLLKNPEHALETLSREELGLNPEELGSPVGAALSSFTAFAVGAFLPLAPFVLGLGGVAGVVLVTLVGLFGVGAALSLFTGRNAWTSGLRMVAIGAGAGLISFLIGKFLGTTVF